jgi:hypothetical protein
MPGKKVSVSLSLQMNSTAGYIFSIPSKVIGESLIRSKNRRCAQT